MPLFIAQSAYLKPLTEIDPHLPDHAAWIKSHSALGQVLTAGRQNPPHVGGVVIFRAADREQVLGWLAEDPYTRLGLATYTVTEFNPRPEPISSKQVVEFMSQA